MESVQLPLATNPFVVVAREFRPEDEAYLRETLKRCSASTFEAACQFRKTGNIEHLPVIIFGVIERYVESNLRPKLKESNDDLRLAEDLGIDSLTMMEIVMQVEDVLQITINNQELRALRTMGEVRQFMEAKIAGPVSAPSEAKLAS
jgi:3-hydroxyacyl-[acyl-carrier-protein] dehydratase